MAGIETGAAVMLGLALLQDPHPRALKACTLVAAASAQTLSALKAADPGVQAAASLSHARGPRTRDGLVADLTIVPEPATPQTTPPASSRAKGGMAPNEKPAGPSPMTSRQPAEEQRTDPPVESTAARNLPGKPVTRVSREAGTRQQARPARDGTLAKCYDELLGFSLGDSDDKANERIKTQNCR